MEALPSDPFHAGISPLKVYGRPGQQLNPKTKQKRQKQQQKEAGKKYRAAKKAKLNSIPELEKTITIISCNIRKTKTFWILRSVI
jgi:hypothetical protein